MLLLFNCLCMAKVGQKTVNQESQLRPFSASHQEVNAASLGRRRETLKVWLGSGDELGVCWVEATDFRIPPLTGPNILSDVGRCTGSLFVCLFSFFFKQTNKRTVCPSSIRQAGLKLCCYTEVVTICFTNTVWELFRTKGWYVMLKKYGGWMPSLIFFTAALTSQFFQQKGCLFFFNNPPVVVGWQHELRLVYRILNTVNRFSISFPRKQFCSCVWPVTLIYCVKMVTFFFSYVCKRPQ